MWEIEHDPTVLMYGIDNESEEFLCESYNIIKPEVTDVKDKSNDQDVDNSVTIVKSEYSRAVAEDDEDNVSCSLDTRLIIADSQSSFELKDLSQTVQNQLRINAIMNFPHCKVVVNRLSAKFIERMTRPKRIMYTINKVPVSLDAISISSSSDCEITSQRPTNCSLNGSRLLQSRLKMSRKKRLMQHHQQGLLKKKRRDEANLPPDERPHIINLDGDDEGHSGNQNHKASDNNDVLDDDDDKCSSIIIRLRDSSSTATKQHNKIKVRPNNMDRNKTWLSKNYVGHSSKNHAAGLGDNIVSSSSSSNLNTTTTGNGSGRPNVFETMFGNSKANILGSGLRIAKKKRMETEQFPIDVPEKNEAPEQSVVQSHKSAWDNAKSSSITSGSRPIVEKIIPCIAELKDEEFDDAGKWGKTNSDEEDYDDTGGGGNDDDIDDDEIISVKQDGSPGLIDADFYADDDPEEDAIAHSWDMIKYSSNTGVSRPPVISPVIPVASASRPSSGWIIDHQPRAPPPVHLSRGRNKSPPRYVDLVNDHIIESPDKYNSRDNHHRNNNNTCRDGTMPSFHLHGNRPTSWLDVDRRQSSYQQLPPLTSSMRPPVVPPPCNQKPPVVDPYYYPNQGAYRYNYLPPSNERASHPRPQSLYFPPPWYYARNGSVAPNRFNSRIIPDSPASPPNAIPDTPQSPESCPTRDPRLGSTDTPASPSPPPQSSPSPLPSTSIYSINNNASTHAAKTLFSSLDTPQSPSPLASTKLLDSPKDTPDSPIENQVTSHDISQDTPQSPTTTDVTIISSQIVQSENTSPTPISQSDSGNCNVISRDKSMESSLCTLSTNNQSIITDSTIPTNSPIISNDILHKDSSLIQITVPSDNTNILSIMPETSKEGTTTSFLKCSTNNKSHTSSNPDPLGIFSDYDPDYLKELTAKPKEANGSTISVNLSDTNAIAQSTSVVTSTNISKTPTPPSSNSNDLSSSNALLGSVSNLSPKSCVTNSSTLVNPDPLGIFSDYGPDYLKELTAKSTDLAPSCVKSVITESTVISQSNIIETGIIKPVCTTLATSNNSDLCKSIITTTSFNSSPKSTLNKSPTIQLSKHDLLKHTVKSPSKQASLHEVGIKSTSHKSTKHHDKLSKNTLPTFLKPHVCEVDLDKEQSADSCLPRTRYGQMRSKLESQYKIGSILSETAITSVSTSHSISLSTTETSCPVTLTADALLDNVRAQLAAANGHNKSFPCYNSAPKSGCSFVLQPTVLTTVTSLSNSSHKHHSSIASIIDSTQSSAYHNTLTCNKSSALQLSTATTIITTSIQELPLDQSSVYHETPSHNLSSAIQLPSSLITTATSVCELPLNQSSVYHQTPTYNLSTSLPSSTAILTTTAASSGISQSPLDMTPFPGLLSTIHTIAPTSNPEGMSHYFNAPPTHNSTNIYSVTSLSAEPQPQLPNIYHPQVNTSAFINPANIQYATPATSFDNMFYPPLSHVDMNSQFYLPNKPLDLPYSATNHLLAPPPFHYHHSTTDPLTLPTNTVPTLPSLGNICYDNSTTSSIINSNLSASAANVSHLMYCNDEESIAQVIKQSHEVFKHFDTIQASPEWEYQME